MAIILQIIVLDYHRDEKGALSKEDLLQLFSKLSGGY